MQNRRDFLKTLGIAAVGLTVVPRFANGVEPDAWQSVYPRILARIKPPTFQKKDFVITKYGAKAGRANDSSEALKKAIDACNKAGGGRVVVPAGEFFTAAVHLKSNVNLYLSKGATLKFSADAAKYPIVRTRFEGMECMNVSPFIYAYEQSNIAVTGEGTLDGQSDKSHWWDWHNDQKPARARLYEMMQRGTPIESRVFSPSDKLRPNFIQPHRCKNVLIEGVAIINSPMWEVHPLLCENVTVRNLSISSHGPNNDGCDPESCKDVLIEGCKFDTGDDCIAIKSGRNEDGRRVNVPTENVIVRNCEMKDGHGGVTIGSEISGGVRNVFAEKCRLDSPNLDHAIRVKNNAARGGLLENFYFRDLTVGQVKHALVTVDFNYEEGSKGQFIPVMRGLYVDRVTSHKSQLGVDIQGLDNAPVSNVVIRDSSFDNVEKGNVVKNLKGSAVENFRINGKLVTSLR